MLGVLLDHHSLGDDLDLTRLRASLPTWRLHAATRVDELPARLAEAEVVAVNKVTLDRAAIAAAPRLRLIAVCATGYNNVDLDAARERGIAVCNVRRYATPSVVQHLFAMLLSLVRNLDRYRHDVARGAWTRSRDFCLLDHPIRELGDLTLGIIGYGELGRHVAQVARDAFGMRVLLAARHDSPAEADRLPLDLLLSEVDVLSLHCPLTAENRGLIGAAELARMRPGAILLNLARGGLVDEAALAEALRSGQLGGAGIDVLAEEPPRHGSPLLDPSLPNLILTPHVAWASRAARQRLIDQVADNISAFANGTPQNLVTPESA